jgi:hypothetical protein
MTVDRDPGTLAELAKALFHEVSPGKNWPLSVLAALFASPKEVWELYAKYCQLLDETFFNASHPRIPQNDSQNNSQNDSQNDFVAKDSARKGAQDSERTDAQDAQDSAKKNAQGCHSDLFIPAPSFLTFVNRRATNGFWKPLPLHMAAYWGHTATVF